ncbi:MAG: MATE family efflux transporter [Lachnospiraceae bacterium]
MNNKLSKEYNFIALLKFALPSIVMMIFVSMYTMVDGFFVSRFVGTDALSAVNFVYPMQSIVVGIAVMFATGGCAIVSFNQGEGRADLANRNFTLICASALIIGITFITFVLCNGETLMLLLGADEVILPYTLEYLQPLLLLLPFSILQLLFQSFFISAGKPLLGLALTIISGVTNMILDYVFIVPLDMGIAGAAYATGIGFSIPAIVGIVFFFSNKKGLHFTRFSFDLNVIKRSAFNGSSEMVTNLSNSVITILFNFFMIKFLGSDGIAAITVVLYAQFLMIGLFLGYSIGVAPIISYHHGSGNIAYVKKIIKYSLIFISCASVLITLISYTSAENLAHIFSGDNAHVASLSTEGLHLFSVAFLFTGINVFGSSLFTALSNGLFSALLSFSRTFFFTVIGIYGLSYLMGYQGLFLAIPFAECVSFIFASYLLYSVLSGKYKLL